MSFGRKGVSPGHEPVQAGGFGRARAGAGAMPAARRPQVANSYYDTRMSDAEILAKREAFLASERAAGNISSAAIAAEPITLIGTNTRQHEEFRVPPIKAFRGSMASTSSKKWYLGEPHKRSLIMAYVLWYFASGLSLHRFYCGQGDSAWSQIGCLFGGFLCLAIWAPLGIMLVVIWGLWIIADLFLMPGMMRRFKAQHDPRNYAGIFD